MKLLEWTQGKASYLWSRQSLPGYGTKSTGNKNKNKQVVPCQTKKIVHRKENNRMRKPLVDWGEILAHRIPDLKKKKMRFQYIEGLLKFNRKKKKKAGLKHRQRLEYVSKEDTQTDNTYMKRCSVSRIIREMQIQTAVS